MFDLDRSNLASFLAEINIWQHYGNRDKCVFIDTWVQAPAVLSVSPDPSNPATIAGFMGLIAM